MTDFLTPRQWEILIGIAEGKCIKAIAADLHIKKTTVEYHRRMLMQRLHVDNDIFITHFALQTGVVQNKYALWNYDI